ncbi:MAG: phage head-tail connector protein [Planctomycetaceae bacterium]
MLTSVETIKSQLGISDPTEDAKLATWLAQADQMIKSYLKRNIEQATYVEFYSGDGTNIIRLRQSPVQSITSLYLDNAGFFGKAPNSFAAASQLSEGADFVLDRDNNSATEKSTSGILWRINGAWDRPSSRVNGTLSTIPGNAMGNVKVTYVAGYATVPADIQAACIQAVAQFREMQVVGLSQSENYEDYSYTLADPSVQEKVMGSMKSLLKPYRKFVI